VPFASACTCAIALIRHKCVQATGTGTYAARSLFEFGTSTLRILNIVAQAAAVVIVIGHVDSKMDEIDEERDKLHKELEDKRAARESLSRTEYAAGHHRKRPTWRAALDGRQASQ
jgi:hypothetical protein